MQEKLHNLIQTNYFSTMKKSAKESTVNTAAPSLSEGVSEIIKEDQNAYTHFAQLHRGKIRVSRVESPNTVVRYIHGRAELKQFEQDQFVKALDNKTRFKLEVRFDLALAAE